MLNDKRKLIITLALLLGSGFAMTSLVNYYVSKAAIRESIVANELPLTSDNIYSEIQKDLVRPIIISSMMASDTFLRDWVLAGEQDVDRMTRFLHEVKARYGAFTSFFVSEKTRIYYQTEGVLKRIRDSDARDAWYFRVRTMKSPYEINVDPDLANKDALTIFINYRVFDYDGRYIGAAGVGLTVDAVRNLIRAYQDRYQRNIYFVDKQGGIPVFGSDSSITATNIHAMEGLGAIAPRILHEGAGNFQYNSGGLDYLLNVRFIPELDWHLFVERIENEALASIRNTLYLNLAICILITAIVLLATSFTINHYQSKLEKMATTDKLTGLVNRQAFDLLVQQVLREQSRAGTSLLAIMIDIDYFKKINDDLGHLAGDNILQQVARVIENTVRKSDIVCRWGGEEFLVVLKDTAATQGRLLAEKIRSAVEAGAFRYKDEKVVVSVSLGIAAYREGEAPDQLIYRADQALYAAKAGGRNRVHSAG
ncbi:MAG: sensor domain-containing diguanylate cyclase [Burkholderiales bacterium]|nr:sensor domain-containing diguanylate cyclase [Burkholderiales bacterium]